MVMSDLNWKQIVSTIAPTLGTLLAGPMAGTAISALSNIFLGTDNGTEQELAKAITTGLTHEKIVEMQQLDLVHKEAMAKIGLDYAKLNQETEIAYISDTADARKYKDDKVFWLGVIILVMFALTMGFSLFGAYQILSGGITIKDVAVVAAVSGFIGSIIGYVSANAQQVVGYFYGSSAGSAQKTKEMSASFKSAIDSVSK
jgi:uncharacterized membrane protein